MSSFFPGSDFQIFGRESESPSEILWMIGLLTIMSDEGVFSDTILKNI